VVDVQPQRPVALRIAMTSIGILAVVAGVVWVLQMRRDDAAQPASQAAPIFSSVPSASSGSPTSVPGDAGSTTSTATASPESPSTRDAVADLRAIAKADREVVETLVNSWVPQLGQYRVGVRSAQQVMPAADLLAFHESMRVAAGAVLLNSNTFQFPRNNLWVTVVPEAFASADEALARCAQLPVVEQGCSARLLTRDDTIAVTSKSSTP
jgi:hypothetical protein